MTGMICTPLDPVPTTATRLPAKSTGQSGHSPVWYDSPSKSSAARNVGEVRDGEDTGGGHEVVRPGDGAVSSVTVHSAARSS
jgi:hypothetical protein